MGATHDSTLLALDEIVRSRSVLATVTHTLHRVLEQLDTSSKLMAWDIVPLEVFDRLPADIRSCWVFVIRAGAATGAERHPNSHQRSLSLIGGGTFELRGATRWDPHPLVSTGTAGLAERWVSIPPSTWHRLFVGSEAWGMLSFHTVVPTELIEETPADANDFDGEIHQERYAGRTVA